MGSEKPDQLGGGERKRVPTIWGADVGKRTIKGGRGQTGGKSKGCTSEGRNEEEVEGCGKNGWGRKAVGKISRPEKGVRKKLPQMGKNSVSKGEKRGKEGKMGLESQVRTSGRGSGKGREKQVGLRSTTRRFLKKKINWGGKEGREKKKKVK